MRPAVQRFAFRLVGDDEGGPQTYRPRRVDGRSAHTLPIAERGVEYTLILLHTGQKFGCQEYGLAHEGNCDMRLWT